jgi:hypothetical protein
MSTTPDELFWKSWLSSFMGNEPEAVGQTESSRTTNQDPNAKKFISDVEGDLNSIITHDAARFSFSMKPDSLCHGTYSPHLSETPIEFPLGGGEKGNHETLSVKCLPALNLEHKKRAETYSGDHAFQKYVWGDGGEDESMDQFLELDQSYSFPFSYHDTTDNPGKALADAKYQGPANDSCYSQQTQDSPLHSPTEFVNRLPVTTQAGCGVSHNAPIPLCN